MNQCWGNGTQVESPLGKEKVEDVGSTRTRVKCTLQEAALSPIKLFIARESCKGSLRLIDIGKFCRWVRENCLPCNDESGICH